MMGMNNAVRVAWRAAPGATRYRVKWAFALWDKWPASDPLLRLAAGHDRAAIAAAGHQPGHGPDHDATPYGNPVWSRVQTANGTRLGPWSAWKVLVARRTPPRSLVTGCGWAPTT